MHAASTSSRVPPRLRRLSVRLLFVRAPRCLCALSAVLTVNPAISALAAAGKPPMLKGNRFILRAAGGGDIAATLQALMVGYVAQLPGPDGKPSGGEEVLTVASPDLLAPPPDDDALKYNSALRCATRRRNRWTRSAPCPACSTCRCDGAMFRISNAISLWMVRRREYSFLRVLRVPPPSIHMRCRRAAGRRTHTTDSTLCGVVW
jgi:hypothetical protein